MAVRAGTAVAGNMLEHREHAAGKQAVGDRAPQLGDLLRVLAIRAVADDGIGAARRHVRDG